MHVANRLQQLEAGLEDAKQAVALRDTILKLTENREFKKVIRENFLETACARYARESADPILSDRQRADALAMAQAAGHLKRWFQLQIQMGDTAAQSIPSYESDIELERSGEDTAEEGDE
jgi:hypothetical protein